MKLTKFCIILFTIFAISKTTYAAISHTIKANMSNPSPLEFMGGIGSALEELEEEEKQGQSVSLDSLPDALLGHVFGFLPQVNHLPVSTRWNRIGKEFLLYCPNVSGDDELAAIVDRHPNIIAIKYSDLTDAGLVLLAQLSSLRHLDLAVCRNITDAGLAHLTNLPLQHLNLRFCNKITDAGLAHLAQLPSLQYLNLSECNITDAGLAHLAQLPSLQYLNLRFCSNITDAGLALLAQLPLQNLDLRRCWHITDDGLAHLSQLPLQYLDLSFCHNITGAGLAHISQLPLQHLDLCNCYRITDTDLEHLAQLPLQHLDLRWPNITDAGRTQLREALPNTNIRY